MIDRVPGLASRAAYAKQLVRHKLLTIVSRGLRSARGLPTTETELKLIAAAAMIGLPQPSS